MEICRECADEQKLIETGKKHDTKQKTANDAQNFDATAYQTAAPVNHTSISSGLADNPTADSPMNGLHIALVGAPVRAVRSVSSSPIIRQRSHWI